jgi:hypothetical protein
MAALWTFGAVGVYVNSLEDDQSNIWAEIDIIDATETELHWYGAKSERWNIGGTLWGRSDRDTLKGYARSSSTITLTGPNTLSVGFKVAKVTSRRIPDKTDVTNECFAVTIEGIKV